jgi:hypothetical protein
LYISNYTFTDVKYRIRQNIFKQKAAKDSGSDLLILLPKLSTKDAPVFQLENRTTEQQIGA